MKRLARFRFAWLALALALPLLSSCKDDGIHGNYTATTFTYASAGSAPKDVLAAGGSITLTIARDLSTSGSIQIPASVTGGNAFSASLLGTAAQNGDVVALNLVADSFLRDLPLTFDGSSLSGTSTVSGTTIIVKLSK